MLFKRAFLYSILCVPLFLSTGCGGGVEPGVADGADEVEPVLTEDEEASEAEAAKSAAQ